MNEAPKPELAPADGAAVSPQQAKFLSSASPFQLYRERVAGDATLLQFLRYELTTSLLTGIPGLVGLGLRSILYPGLFTECGRRPVFCRDVSVFNPGAMRIGTKVLVDEHVCLHAWKGCRISIGDYVSVGRFSSIIARGGDITLERGVNIGAYCRIASETKIRIGESTLIAAYTYIGPGNHQMRPEADDGVPLIARGMELKGGVSIGSNVWIGSKATILDGVTIGDGAVIGAHSLVRDDVPARAIAVGTPARVIRYLDGEPPVEATPGTSA